MNRWISDSLPNFGFLSSVPLASFCVIVVIYLILSHFVIFRCDILEACAFVMRDRKKVDPDRRERRVDLRQVQGLESLISIF